MGSHGLRVMIYLKDEADRRRNGDGDVPQFWRGIYTGIRYQCVELARRYLVIKHDLIFDQVPNAYDIFALRSIYDMRNQRMLPWPSHPNRCCHLPKEGSLLIWANEGYFVPTGHVAVITHVGSNFVDIIEQNDGDGHRRLPIRDGRIVCSRGGRILGWKDLPFHSGK